MLHQTYYSDSYDIPHVPVPHNKASVSSIETLQTIDEAHPFEEEYDTDKEYKNEEPSPALSAPQVSQCCGCGTKYNYTFRFRRIIMILLVLLGGILVTLVVVLVTRNNNHQKKYHGPLYQYIVDVQHGEIDLYLNDSLDGTWSTTTCKTMLAIHQTKRCFSDDMIVKLVHVDLHNIATVTIELIPEEYEKGCDFYWNVTAVVDSNKYGLHSFVESCLYQEEDNDDDDDDNSFTTKYTHHEVRVKVTGVSTR